MGRIMAKFKVGDQVTGNAGYSFDPIIGIINTIDRNLFSVKVTSATLEDYKGRSNHIWDYNKKHLRLLPPKEWDD